MCLHVRDFILLTFVLILKTIFLLSVMALIFDTIASLKALKKKKNLMFYS